MDRDVSPRVAYWLSSFDPQMEAVAGEVACLRQAFAGSVAWGVGSRQWMRVSWQRGFGVHPRLHWLFRGLAGAGQHLFQINHLFGGFGDWFHLRTATRRPLVMTVAVQNGLCDRDLIKKVSRFVVEWPQAGEELASLGIDQSQISLIYPPVDLERFRAQPRPQGDFTVLFASSPDKADWLEARGVHLILDAAERCPQMTFLMLWRPWGDSLRRLRSWVDQRRARNVIIMEGCLKDMAEIYSRAHVTVAPFTLSDRAKPVPNSIVESLACGRPVVVTDTVQIADLIAQQGAGLVCEPTGASLAESLLEIERDWQHFSLSARILAETSFGQSRFIEQYEQIYREVL